MFLQKKETHTGLKQCVWVNDENIFIFGWNIPLNKTKIVKVFKHYLKGHFKEYINAWKKWAAAASLKANDAFQFRWIVWIISDWMNLSLPSLDLEAQLIISKWLILNKYATHVVWNRGCTHSLWSVHNGVLFERDTDPTANNLKALHLKVSEEQPAENVFMAFTSKNITRLGAV